MRKIVETLGPQVHGESLKLVLKLGQFLNPVFSLVVREVSIMSVRGTGSARGHEHRPRARPRFAHTGNVFACGSRLELIAGNVSENEWEKVCMEEDLVREEDAPLQTRLHWCQLLDWYRVPTKEEITHIMELQIAADLMHLCATREYGLRHVRNALYRGYGADAVAPDDMSYLLVLFLEQDSPWSESAESQDMLQVLRGTDATRIAMAMVQRGVHDADVVARIFANLMHNPDLDPRTAHVLCNILHLVNVDALVDRLFSQRENGTVKHRLRAATSVSKRTRLRTCRCVIQQLRDAL